MVIDTHLKVSLKELPSTPPLVMSMRLDEVLRCPPPSQYFVGREAILIQLCKIFFSSVTTSDNRVNDLGQRVVTLVATGGTGKTEVVLKFVSSNVSR